MNKQSLPLTSTHWGTYRVQTQGGRVTALHPFEEDNDPSPIGPGIVDVLDAPSRIRAPMVRQSYLELGPGSHNERRGVEPFVEISWHEATQLVAAELQRVRQTYGNQAIYGGSYGWASAGRFHHAQSHLKRFLNSIGGFTRSVNTYSFAAAEVAVPHIIGGFYNLLEEQTSWTSIVEQCQLLVAFGGIPLKNGQINSGGLGRHIQKESVRQVCEAGVELINISPLRSDICESAEAEWLAARPGSDTAIMLAMMHTLYTEELYDRVFIERYTHGFKKFVPYLTGERDGVAKDAEWAANISGLSARAITALARRMAERRTMISVSWSLTRQDHGEQPYWAAITLAAMLGQIGLSGGGITFGYSAINGIGSQATRIPGASLPQGHNPIDDYIPVARISDMLLNPGKEFDFNGKRLKYPDIKLVYWAGGNPFHHHQDLNRLLKAWQQPDSIIVHEWCWNSLAKNADIVLPCTVSLEREDIAFSPRDPYVVAMEKAVEPPATARNDYAIFSDIAEHMGVASNYTEGRSESQWLNWLYEQTRERFVARGFDMPDYAALKEQGWYCPDAPAKPRVFLEDFRQDPQANPLATPSGLIEIYSPTVAAFNYEDCPGHPVWLEPAEWLGSHELPFPLHLISNQPHTKLHSQLDHGSYSRSAKIAGREPLMLHPDDARSRGLKHGDIVRVFNDRGACLASVIVDDQVMPSVVQMATGAWFDPQQAGPTNSICKHGNPNVLTLDKGTSKLGQGPIAHSCLVQVERYQGELPEVTAFEPPTILNTKPK